MIGPMNGTSATDLTALAIKASNLRGGIAAGPGSAGTPMPRDRGPAVAIDARTSALAEAASRAAEAEEVPEAATPQHSTARREMVDGARDTYAHLLNLQNTLQQEVRLYEKTGKVFSVQPNGTFELTEEDLKAWGGAEGYIKDTRARLDRLPDVLDEQAKAVASIAS